MMDVARRFGVCGRVCRAGCAGMPPMIVWPIVVAAAWVSASDEPGVEARIVEVRRAYPVWGADSTAP